MTIHQTNSRNYDCPHVDPHWADRRETHIAVATAIHAIADSKRTAESIWENPRSAEWDHVAMAVEEYIANGSFTAADDGHYRWGEEIIVLCC